MGADRSRPGPEFERGMEARSSGLTLADNPHGPESPAGRDWAAGFSATFDLDEEDDPLSDRLRKEDEVPDPDPFKAPGSI